MHNKKLKILTIGWGWPPTIEGGLDTHIYNLSKALTISDDTYIDIFLPEKNTPPKTDIKSNLNIHPIKITWDNTSIDKLVTSVKKYNQEISKTNLRPDIIHIHDWIGVETGIYFKKHHNTPFILTIHSLEYMRSATENSEDSSIIASIEKEGITNADKIITVSNYMKEKILEKYDIVPEKITIITNGPTFTDERTPKDKETKKENGLIVYCGRLSGQKGIEYLLLSAKLVLEKKSDAKFIIIGKGYLEKSLKEFTKLLGIKDSVKFKGFISQEQIKNYYKKAEVIVIPSIYEPFGISVLDALTIGTPTITTENTGIAENLKDKKDILKVQGRNSKHLAESILSILDNQTLKETLSLNGKLASKKYSWNNIANRTKNIYLNLL